MLTFLDLTATCILDGKQIVFTKYLIGNEPVCRFFSFFHLNASTGRNLCRFSLNTNCWVNICTAFGIQSVRWAYHIGLSIKQETKKQEQNDCYKKGKYLTLAVGLEDTEFFPEGFILKLLLAGERFNSFLLDEISNIFLRSSFSLSPNYLVNIGPAYIIHWTYQDGLSIRQETKRQGQKNCYEKEKALKK